ncbi:MAG: hypothetical protein LH616_08715 [Ilumatobacteraceae bacterium]|nr:hypothetical protein [Ilumatobacteraceae bacterium]
MAAQAWFSRGDADVTPGTVAVLQLTVVNLGDTTDTFVLTPAGMAAGWTTIDPATLTLFGGTQQIVDIEVFPPLLPSTTAGPTSLSIRIIPQSDPDDVRSAETTLNIAGSFDRRLDVLQPALRGRRSATYEMMLENRGNTQASCRLHLIDSSGRIEAEFDPPAAGVEPGGSTLIRMKVRTKRFQWERRARTIPFRIDADQPGSPTATSNATFVQTPMVPEHLVGRTVGLLSVAAVVLAGWFGVVKPAIRDAANTAVREAVPETTTTNAPTIDSQTGVTVQPTVPQEEEGTIINIPLSVSVPVGQSDTAVYKVPAGQRLRVTDIIVQNPNSDQGSLLLLRGDVPLFTFNLAACFGDVSAPLVTPIELLAGEELSVQVTCTSQGDQTLTTCFQNVFASGILLPA